MHMFCILSCLIWLFWNKALKLHKQCASEEQTHSEINTGSITMNTGTCGIKDFHKAIKNNGANCEPVFKKEVCWPRCKLHIQWRTQNSSFYSVNLTDYRCLKQLHFGLHSMIIYHHLDVNAIHSWGKLDFTTNKFAMALNGSLPTTML